MKNTITLWFLLALFMLSGCTGQTEKSTSNIALIPQPAEMITGDGYFRFDNTTGIKIDTSNPELTKIAEYFSQVTNSNQKVSDKGKIHLEIKEVAQLGDEGYQLEVKKNSILITANKPAGVFFGLQTLLQLLPAEIKTGNSPAEALIPTLKITDQPQFAWRGIMLDVSRHWFTVEEVKRLLDQMAEYKFNVFHWHLTDDQGWRIEIPALPELTRVGAWRVPRVGQWWQREPAQKGEAATYGGFYTRAEMEDVIQYAADRYIRVIPEVDVPGHNVAALLAYPYLACLNAPDAVNVGNKFYGIDENSLCAGKESTFEWLATVLDEVADIFPDEYIHIGGDECFKGFWNKCPHCQKRMKEEGLKDVDELQSYFIRRVSNMLEAKGKKIIGWDEIHEGGLAEGATVMSWRGMAGGIAAAKAGHKVIMTPNRHCYLDLYQGEPSVEPDTYSMARLTDSFHFNPVPEVISKDFILGGQGNLWAESVPTFRHAEYMLWPRGWALAEVLWSGYDTTEWEDFYQRVEKHFVRADIAQVNYARSMYNAIINPYEADGNVWIELDCEIPDTDIYYTFDNTDPDPYTPKYNASSPLSIPKDATWLRVATYRNGKPSGKVITLTIEEIKKRSKGRERVVGNLDL